MLIFSLLTTKEVIICIQVHGYQAGQGPSDGLSSGKCKSITSLQQYVTLLGATTEKTRKFRPFVQIDKASKIFYFLQRGSLERQLL